MYEYKLTMTYVNGQCIQCNHFMLLCYQWKHCPLTWCDLTCFLFCLCLCSHFDLMCWVKLHIDTFSGIFIIACRYYMSPPPSTKYVHNYSYLPTRMSSLTWPDLFNVGIITCSTSTPTKKGLGSHHTYSNSGQQVMLGVEWFHMILCASEFVQFNSIV